MNTNIDLSIIVVSYNEAEYLTKAINSCLDILKENRIEIIIGDDGSSDNSLEIIKSFLEKYPDFIQFFVMPRDEKEPVIASLRVSNVIKKALEIANGKYCYILSGDDYICDPQFLIKSLEVLNENEKYSSTVAKSYTLIWPDSTKKDIHVPSITPKLYWTGSYSHISCFVFRKEIALKNILDRFFDDTGLEYSLINKTNTWKYLDYTAFYYRQRDKSIMHSSNQTELSIIELMLCQDCLNQKKNIGSSYIYPRFSSSLNYLFTNRHELTDLKYKKYIDSCNRFKNNILKELLDYDHNNILKKSKLLFLLGYSKYLSSFLFKLLRNIYLKSTKQK